MNDRRGFLRGLGLFSAVLGGGAVHASGRNPPILEASVVGASTNPDPVDISHLQPFGADNITLTSTNKPTQYSYASDNSYTIGVQGHQSYVVMSSPPVTERNEVKMAVGKDNRLWLEIDGVWKRVALEG